LSPGDQADGMIPWTARSSEPRPFRMVDVFQEGLPLPIGDIKFSKRRKSILTEEYLSVQGVEPFQHDDETPLSHFEGWRLSANFL
jgi:hypothetical protein